MNPRYRRLLIPGLLVTLLVVVFLASLVRRADSAETASSQTVSRIADERITESSGLAVSRVHDDLAYTINDSGHANAIYAVRISTGDVVGVTRVTGPRWFDTEALALDHRGTLWVADVGDNRKNRRDPALYALEEPGAGDQTVSALRYPIALPDGPEDIETLLADPNSGRLFVVTKTLGPGRLGSLPKKMLAGQANPVRFRKAVMPMMATDGAFSPDGRYAVVRNYLTAVTYESKTWKKANSLILPLQKQGETLAFEPSGRSYLVGSEGRNSPLIRVRFDQAVPTSKTVAEPGYSSSATTDMSGDSARPWILAAVGVASLAACGWLIAKRRGA